MQQNINILTKYIWWYIVQYWILCIHSGLNYRFCVNLNKTGPVVFVLVLVPYNNINNRDWNFSNHFVGLSDLKANISSLNSISILFYNQYTLFIHSTGEKVKILVLQILIFSESERTNVSFKRSSESLHWSAEAWLGQNTLHNWKLNFCELVAFC